MNWYKKAQRMFELFGLDEYLHEQFLINLPIWRKQIQSSKRTLRKYNLITKLDIENYLTKIFERHGNPKDKKTSIIYLVATIDENKENYGSNTLLDEYMALCVSIGNDLKLSKLQEEELKYTIGHELQEIIRSLYAPVSNNSEGTRLEYISSESEIRSISYEKALAIMDAIKEDPEKSDDQERSYMRSVVIAVCNKFFEEEKHVIGYEIPNNIKKKYYIAVLSNVQKMYEDWKKYELV